MNWVMQIVNYLFSKNYINLQLPYNLRNNSFFNYFEAKKKWGSLPKNYLLTQLVIYGRRFYIFYSHGTPREFEKNFWT